MFSICRANRACSFALFQVSYAPQGTYFDLFLMLNSILLMSRGAKLAGPVPRRRHVMHQSSSTARATARQWKFKQFRLETVGTYPHHACSISVACEISCRTNTFFAHIKTAASAPIYSKQDDSGFIEIILRRAFNNTTAVSYVLCDGTIRAEITENKPNEQGDTAHHHNRQDASTWTKFRTCCFRHTQAKKS